MTTTFVQLLSNGKKFLAKTIGVSTGAPDADKIPSTNAGGVLDLSIVNGTVASAGAGSAGKIVALDAAGKIDATTLPTGIGSDALSYTTSEAIAAGNLVNLWDDTGTTKARRADASNGREAHGYAPAGAGSGAVCTVNFEGTITGLSGRAPGATQFLSSSTPGACTETAPTTAGQIVQSVGFATGTTSVSFERDEPTTLG